MKIKNLREQLRNATVVELQGQLVTVQQALLKIRLDQAAGQVKDYSQYKKLRRVAARIQTYIMQKITNLS